jgi:hypothetical protein
VTPTAVRKKVEALARERDILLGTVAEAERRSDELASVVREKRRRLAEVLVQLAEAMPS